MLKLFLSSLHSIQFDWNCTRRRSSIHGRIRTCYPLVGLAFTPDNHHAAGTHGFSEHCCVWRKWKVHCIRWGVTFDVWRAMTMVIMLLWTFYLDDDADDDDDCDDDHEWTSPLFEYLRYKAQTYVAFTAYVIQAACVYAPPHLWRLFHPPFSPFAGSDDNTVRIWDTHAQSECDTHPLYLIGVAIDRSGRFMAASRMRCEK